MKKKILLVTSIILLTIFVVGFYTQILYPIKIEKVMISYYHPFEVELSRIQEDYQLFKKGIQQEQIFLSEKEFPFNKTEDYTIVVILPLIKNRSIIPVDSTVFFPKAVDSSIKDNVIFFENNRHTLQRISPFSESYVHYVLVYYSQGKLSEEEIKEIVEKVNVDIYLQRRWLGTRKLRFKIPMDRLVIEERIRE